MVQESNAGDQEFLYGIAKISQGLRKFRNPSEISLWPNFRYDSEISLSKRKFVIIAKITVHSEIQIFTMPAIFAMIAKVTVYSENLNFHYA